MKHGTSFMKRCLAAALALVMIISCANLGLVQQALAADKTSVSIAQIIADNYDLSEAEKELLKSGYLVSDSFEYTVPSDEDELVSVDTENAKITAESKNGWEPVKAVIVYGGNELEVALTDGVGTYDAAVVGNAFSVKVIYELTTEVEVSVQEALLGAAALLQQGVKNLDDVAAQSGNLYILEQAVPALVDLSKNGIDTGTALGSINLSDDGKDAVTYLDNQMTANGGVLNLSKMISEYEAGAKTSYLINNGNAMKAEIETFVEKTAELVTGLNTMAEYAEMFMGMNVDIDPALVNQVKTLAKSCETLSNDLAAVAAAPWAVEETAALVKADANFAALDTLVAALGETTVVAAKNPLNVAATTLQANLSMWNVTYVVALNHVENNEIVEAYQAQKVETLADGATAAEILAAFEGLEDQLLGQWADVYVEGKFVRSADAMPDTLTEDLTYVVIYNPKNFTVDIAGEINEYPYGYKLVLPAHADPTKSYDYKDANGKYYAQGTTVVVEDDMTFTREEGKSYTAGELFAIITDNYASENAKVAAILASGAVKGNEAISYREPSKAELEELVKLEGNTLTVQSYASSYAGLNWAPYSYVVDGVEKLFNGENEVVIAGDFETVSVYYRLTMTNYTEAEVRAIFDLVAELVEEAEGQKSVMDRLASYKDQMSQLNKNMLNGLIGMIGGYAVSEGGQFSDELVAQMKATIQDIVANCCAPDGSLKINAVIDGYLDENNGGLTYYYQNADSIKEQVNYLSEKLEALLGDPQGKDLIATLLNDMNYGDYVDKLDDLNAKIAEINAELAPVNENIDTTDAAKLSALAKALTMEGSVEVIEVGSPYIQMGPVVRTADKYVTIEVKVNADGKTNTFTATVLKNTALTQAQVNELKASVNAFVSGVIETAYYNNNFANGAELDALVGVALTEGNTYTYTWTPKEYVVKIAGEADQIVSINKLTITLPGHPNAANGMSYEYTIGSKTAKAGIYTFNKTDLLTLFVDGVLTITRVEKSESVEKLVSMVNTINADMGFEALKLVSKDGVYTGIEANISAEDMMNLMMGLVMKSGYSYIGLNNEGFIYSTEDGLQMSMQTLIDALLNDDDFSNETIIALGEKGKGQLLTASMQLGNSASELHYANLTFTLNLKSVPSVLVNYTKYIKTISQYITFHSDNGVMAIELNLPDQAYAAYAAALVATGNVEKTDVNGLKQRVPVQFLYDYMTAITGSEMDLETFTNTLEMMGVNRSLTSYNDYYTKALAAYNQFIDVEIADDLTTVNATIPGQKSIDALLTLMGIGTDKIGQFLPMLKEYKAGAEIKMDLTGKLLNVNKTYYALIVDAQASGVTNKVAAPTSVSALNAETSTLAGYSAIILTANVDGDLTISGNTVLDLNGFDVTGTINATGKLFIIDSTMDTYNAGTVGGVTGNATILAGNYNSDVSSLLQDGYYMDGTTVRNALYKITEVDGTITFTLNGDVYEDEHVSNYIPEPKALAIDIATDLLLNYFTTAKLSVGGYELIGVDVDDLVGLYAGDDRINKLAQTLIGCFTIGEAGYENNAGFEGLVNLILADLIDFEAITNALENNTALFTYEITTEPWLIEIDHNTAEDYATIDVRSNSELAKTFNIALVIESKVNDNVAAMTGVLADIVVADETEVMVDLPTPTFSDKTLSIYGAGKANVVMDMSHNTDYVTVIGVVLAYGNPAKAEAVAAALNKGDMDAMKKIIDNTSVAEIFTALKKLARNVDFKAMAEQVGVNVTNSAAEIEGAFHLVLCAAGKALEKLDITGMNSKLGGLYNAETGYYELTKSDIFRDKEFTARGYTALVELEATELSLKVKLFADENCKWGDANHDGKVNALDATLVLQYTTDTLAEGQEFCTVRTDVNGDGKINALDATLILQHSVGTITKFPAEN